MSEIEITNIPSAVDSASVYASLEYFLLSHRIYSTITAIKYVGGCSNHALKVTVKNDQGSEEKLLVRLPGHQSELLVNRHAERENTTTVAALGICPLFNKQFVETGKILHLEGFKVEEFLDNAHSLDHDTFNQYRSMALSQLKKVHDSRSVFLTEYNIFDRILMMCYLVRDTDQSSDPVLTNTDNKPTTLATIIAKVLELQTLADVFENVELSPCHNDITPFNFMKTADDTTGSSLKIIDWEYSGMNDAMFELAYIANENGCHNSPLIASLV